MIIGTKFSTYGWYSNGDAIVCVEDHRVKTAAGSHVESTERCDAAFPNTAAGAKAANAWSLAMNISGKPQLWEGGAQ